MKANLADNYWLTTFVTNIVYSYYLLFEPYTNLCNEINYSLSVYLEAVIMKLYALKEANSIAKENVQHRNKYRHVSQWNTHSTYVTLHTWERKKNEHRSLWNAGRRQQISVND